MKLALPSGLLFLCIGTAANAQLSVVPQIGLENSKTSFSTNNSSFTSLGSAVAPKASVRLDYRFKQGHGPYLGFGSSSGIASVTTTNPENILSNYTSSLGDPKWRMEAGYGFSTKAINLKKNSVSTSAKQSASTATNSGKRGCGSNVYRSGCTRNKEAAMAAKKAAETWNMRIQPTAGVAFTNAANNAVVTETGGAATNYSYKSGNWNTAVTTGVGFEFAKGTARKFVISLNYLKGITNLGKQDVTSVNQEKSTTTQIQSRASAWNVTFGIPFTLSKKKAVVQAKPQMPQQRNTQYKRCGGGDSYKRCTRSI